MSTSVQSNTPTQNNNELVTEVLQEQKRTQNTQKSAVKKIEKDQLIVQNEKQALKELSANKKSPEAPSLPAPQGNFSGNVPQREVSMIAIMSEVLTLQAKVSSRNWSVFWANTSESMLSEVKFAPIIGAAIQAAGQAQAHATQEDAYQALTTGLVSTVTFVVTVGMGMKMSAEENAEIPDKDINVGDQSAEGEEENVLDQKQPKNEGIKQESRELEEKAGASKFESFKKGGKKFFSKYVGFAGKFGMVAQGTNMFSTGINDLAKAGFQSSVATQQALKGKEDAISQEAQLYAGFFGKSVSLEQSLSDAASKGVQNSMDIYKSAVDQITSTVTSMFRG